MPRRNRGGVGVPPTIESLSSTPDVRLQSHHAPSANARTTPTTNKFFTDGERIVIGERLGPYWICRRVGNVVSAENSVSIGTRQSSLDSSTLFRPNVPDRSQDRSRMQAVWRCRSARSHSYASRWECGYRGGTSSRIGIDGVKQAQCRGRFHDGLLSGRIRTEIRQRRKIVIGTIASLDPSIESLANRVQVHIGGI